MQVPITLGLVGVTSETFPCDIMGGRHDNLGRTFGRPAPKKFGRAKNCKKKFGAIFDNI